MPEFRWAIWWLLAAGVACGQECSNCHENIKLAPGGAHAAQACLACHAQHDQVPHPQVKPAECASCHAQAQKEHAASVHAQAGPDCGLCHGTAHEAIRAKSVDFRKSQIEKCGACHSDVAEHFSRSVHGRDALAGIAGVPVCSDCHAGHAIQKAASPAQRERVRETCTGCHADLRLARRFGLPSDRVTTFEASFHGLAVKAGSQTVANCASCHGYHDILPSTDPKSMTHPSRLPETCGRCHRDAGSRFALGPVHLGSNNADPPPVVWVRLAYQVLIPVVIGLMLLHNGGDFVRKLWAGRIQPALKRAAATGQTLALHKVPRMLRAERWQHAALAVSFIVLVWSGFALRYSSEWWARPLVAWEAQFSLRGVVHRAAGVVMIGVSIFHAISLVLSGQLRRHWLELVPRVRDVREAWTALLWNLGLRAQKPRISSHSYIEKAEYWAVVWGTAIMALTGVLLWANQWSLANLPKVFLDVAREIHLWEAVLAALSVLVWHFYFVIFDPEVYPMDTAWLTGNSLRPRPDEHGGEEAPPA
jgi:cytochrome b subunit of formate dehydrogenase